MQRRFMRNSTKLDLKKGGETMMDESEFEKQENEVGVSVNDTGFCTLCGKNSVCKCERCGDFYCSPLCQREDWHNHRFICFPMPRLVNVGLKLEIQNGGKSENVPHLKADIKPVDVVKAENRQAYKARQLGSNALEVPRLKAGCCVVLTGFTSSNRCYIRSANPAITEEYKKILRKIDDFGRTSTALGGTPELYSFAIARKDDKWCRVKILKIRSDNQIRIHFVDYGSIGVLPLSELRKTSEDIISLPCYVNVVQLHSITSYTSEENLLNKLSRFTGKEYNLQYMNNDETSVKVELYYWGTNNLLNSEIVNICRHSNDRDTKLVSNNDVKPKVNGYMEKKEYKKASPSAATAKDNFKSKIDTVDKSSSEAPAGGKAKDNFKSKIDTAEKCSSEMPAGVKAKDNFKSKTDTVENGRDKKRNLPPPPRQIQIQKPCLEPPFETILFDENDRNTTVFIVDNSYVGRGYIGCMLEKYRENLQSITKYLQTYDANDQPYSPKLNEYCLAQYENEWYRAKVIEVFGGDNYQVVYIDFSNELKLSSKSIRRYPMSLTLPCCTSLCGINGLPEELGDDVIECLEQKCGHFQKLTVDAVKMVEGVPFIISRELLKTLGDKNLI